MNIVSNINMNERIIRIAIGVVLFLAALVGLGRFFLLLAGIYLAVEGALGWSGIVIALEKLGLLKK